MLSLSLSNFQNYNREQTLAFFLILLAIFKKSLLPSSSSMASPSKLPISQETPIDHPPPGIASSHPDPASSPLSDSINALFNTEKADLVEDSLTSIGRKRDRDGDEATDGTPRAQHHRSTRNP